MAVSLSSVFYRCFPGEHDSLETGTPMAMVTHLVDLCLRRSRDSSLSVKFVEIGSPVKFKDIFDLLSRYSNRWEELFLSLSMLSTESPAFITALPGSTFSVLAERTKVPRHWILSSMPNNCNACTYLVCPKPYALYFCLGLRSQISKLSYVDSGPGSFWMYRKPCPMSFDS